MKRRMMEFLFALGLVLTLATAVVFVRGFWAADAWAADWDRRDKDVLIASSFEFRSNANRVEFFWIVHRYPDSMDKPLHPLAVYHMQNWPESPTFPGRFTFTRRTMANDGFVKWAGSVPTWFLLLTLISLTCVPAWPLWRTRRSRSRRLKGLCITCGYDLRGVEHERCPECGADVERSVSDPRGVPPAAVNLREGPQPGASS